MRFLSANPRGGIVLWNASGDFLTDGSWRQKTQGYTAQFHENDFDDFERELALEHFGAIIDRSPRFYGNLGDPLVERVPNEWRIGTFDTNLIDDEELRARVEKALLAHRGCGKDFIQVVKPAVPKPWESYDELRTAPGRNLQWVVSQIEQIALVTRTDPDLIERYERANEDREAVYALCDRLRERAAEEAEAAKPEVVLA